MNTILLINSTIKLAILKINTMLQLTCGCRATLCSLVVDSEVSLPVAPLPGSDTNPEFSLQSTEEAYHASFHGSYP